MKLSMSKKDGPDSSRLFNHTILRAFHAYLVSNKFKDINIDRRVIFLWDDLIDCLKCRYPQEPELDLLDNDKIIKKFMEYPRTQMLLSLELNVDYRKNIVRWFRAINQAIHKNIELPQISFGLGLKLIELYPEEIQSKLLDLLTGLIAEINIDASYLNKTILKYYKYKYLEWER